MMTVNVLTPGFTPTVKSDANRGLASAKNQDGSLQTVYEFISSRREGHVRKSLVPLAVKSMKIIEQSRKSAYSPVCSMFQTCTMSTSRSRVKTNGSPDIMTEEIPATTLGVKVFILKDNKILFGRRRSLAIAANTYSLPGGHLEPGESHEECAEREVKEETGLDIKNIELLTATNNVLSDTVHLVVIYMRARLSDPDQIPQNIEPDKCEGWEWYDLKNLPEPTFEPLRAMLQGGFNPFPVDS